MVLPSRTLGGSLCVELGDVVNHIVAMDALVGLDFKDMYQEVMKLYVSEDVMYKKHSHLHITLKLLNI